MRINDEEEQPDDYTEDVVVAVAFNQMQKMPPTVCYIPGHCDARRVKVVPKR